MANKKNKLSKPTKSSAKLNFKVRYYPDKKPLTYVVTNKRKKVMEGKTFTNHDSALEFAKELHTLHTL